jgi:DNA transformation protein and related proteins
MNRPVAQLQGLGPKSSVWLAEIGIHTEADLRAIGSLEAWHRLRFVRRKQVTLNALYAMEAALRDCHWRALPEDVKALLKAEAAGATTRPKRR